MTRGVDLTEDMSPDAVFARIGERIAPALPPDALDRAVTPPFGDHSLNTWEITPDVLSTARDAAVLVGLVVRERGINVLLTQRTGDLRDHAGQIAFPGGKMDPGDSSPAETAVREAREEIGLPGSCIDILGYMDAYLTRTGYRIVPVIARITPPFELTINPAEVVDAFEVPFDHLMRAANYQLNHREWQGAPRAFYVVRYGDRHIWGITAGILRILHDRLML